MLEKPREEKSTLAVPQNKGTLKGSIKVTPSLSNYPRSHAANYKGPEPITSEQEALRSLKHEWKRLSDNSPIPQTSKHENKTIVADLQDFEIYRCPTNDKTRPYELASLHLFDVKAKNLCFDGYVRLGNVKHYLEGISIEDLSIGGYGRTKSTRIDAYIQTKLASNDRTHDIWFQLRKPAPRYERFHTPFLWVATFGKHVIDYMDSQPKASVRLESFHADFHSWLMQRFGRNKKFKLWFGAFHNTSDFRVAASVYIDYIMNQAYNLSTSTHLTSHPLWAQCKCDRRLAVKIQPKLVKETVTTPRVFECFQDMYFASKLKRVDLSRDVKKAQEKRMRSLGFAKSASMRHSTSKHTDNTSGNISVHVGDVVSIVPDEVDKRKWQKSGDEWLAYVQGIELCNDEQQRLMVLWLYRPLDTNIFLARYPVAKEVFLSDNCNCGEWKIFSTDVTQKYSVDWSPQILDTAKDLIIRQTYITQDSAFLTVNDDHKLCSCRKPKITSSGWRAGDTVYVSKAVGGTQLLEPVLIHDINYKSNEVIVRTLLRLDRDCTQLATKAGRTKVAPNELVLTGRLKALPISRIKRRCHVRFVPQHDLLEDRMPSWYKARGSGDFWYISMGLESVNDVQRLFFLDRLPHGFHEAQEAPLSRPRLKGLSLFSGGGSLDRGLEEGGAVEFQTAVDYDPAAIHTQRANCRDPARMRLFCGSVDDYLQSLLFGNANNSVALVNAVELISAGSPCPGFSALQQNMLSNQSLTYASHITTFCTAVDVYRPLYGILENVVNMASTRKGLEEQNVLSQLVACLVSMGYQVNQYIMDSWTYGSFQRRSRIILTIAAPGLEPILQRPHTHSRPYEETMARSLGKLPNGERFGDREHYPTPFPIVTAGEATSDLPNIGNGNVQSCIPFPDHRLSRSLSSNVRALIESIPIQPPGYGYAEAINLELVPPLLRLRKKEVGRAYRRIKADGLVPTITTDVSMQDARNGASVHWSQHRPLSIQEARRTQGYPDHEPIIGTLREQWKIIGNGVDRKVSFSIGLALRDALTKSSHKLKSNHAEDELELLVDAEDEPSKRSKGRKTRSVFFGLQENTAHSLASSSTDSFSSRLGKAAIKPSTDLGMSLDGAQDCVPPVAGPRSVALQQSVETEETRSATVNFFSHLTNKISTNVGRLSLPAFPTFFTSSELLHRPKRKREDEEKETDDQESEPLDDRNSSFKRARFSEVPRTLSLVSDGSESDTRPTARGTSLPLVVRTRHTRTLGPAEFAPRVWNRKIGSPDNVVRRS